MWATKVLGLSMVAAVLAACRPAPGPEGGVSASDGPGVTLEKPEFSETAAGQPLWTVAAFRAHYRAGPKVASLERVEARFYESGRPVSRASAPWATYDHAAHDLRLGGGLQLRTLDGRAGVDARDARWDQAEGRLLTGGGVSFWHGANRLTATTLRADRALRRVELSGRVRGAISLEPALIARGGEGGR
ncbi:MAG: LPS export ABC transporter periplasmic protein LptC [Candidatus Sericytochromatia bacterium]|nr:LPS export ABC transporter periplasmic protein LptC [Candidatus Sericytochromatia bacterium]